MRRLIIIAIVFVACSCSDQEANNLDMVDPMIGTDGTGHTFPGATVPFGMVQLSPSNDFKGWAWCSGYHYQDSVLKGFAHTHISGAGLTGLGDFLFMPTTGEPKLLPGSEAEPETGYRSRFSHKRENASPGYYQVHLDDYDIRVELTAGRRSGYHRYTFKKEGAGNVIIDPTHSVGEAVIDAGVEFLSDTELRGFKKSTGDAGTPRTVFFYARFSKPFSAKGVYENGRLVKEKEKVNAPDARAYVRFNVEKGEKIEAGVALSFVNQKGAEENFEHETAGYSFDEALKNARDLWKEKLEKFDIEAQSKEDERTFYTAVYHSYISPNLIADVNGNYIIEGEKYGEDPDHYSTFSTWDTYRALHPLFTIIDNKSNARFVQSLVSRHFVQKVGLPLWEFIGHDNKCMIGYNTVSPMVEAVLKNNEGVDAEKVYEAVTAAANNTDPSKSSVVYGLNGMEGYLKMYRVPGEINTSVAKTTEQNYFDWCIAQLAKKLGKMEEYEYYKTRSLGYRDLFHPEHKKLWPKYASGKWRAMDTTSWYDYEMNYVSGNIWGYSSYVPHDVSGLSNMIGGPGAFAHWLDDVFSDTVTLKGKKHVDISGFIGKYGHGDEPSHHMTYLYNYTGKPWKTQEKVRRVMRDFYSDEPDGLVNNEDLGQMSAWYVFSALGFYPVNPCGLYYDIGSPRVEKGTIHLENGKSFTVIARNNRENNVYIESATLNGEPFNRNYITHEEIMQGGVLKMTMGPEPNMERGITGQARPASSVELTGTSKSERVVPAPFDDKKRFVFEEQTEVKLSCLDPEATIHYTLDGSSPDQSTERYTAAIRLTEQTTIKAIAVREGWTPSVVMEQTYVKGLDLREGNDIGRIEITSPPDVRGDKRGRTQFDGIPATSYHSDKNWSVWRMKDAAWTVAFNETTTINRVTVTYLDHTGMNIFPPEAISLSFSRDGESFHPLKEQTDIPVRETLNPEINRMTIRFDPVKAKHLKVVVNPFGPMPNWYKGSGQPASLYIGELMIH